MRDQYIKSGDGFLLVYSVTDRWSFHAVTAFREQILAVKGQKHKILPDISLILVGNKVRVNKTQTICCLILFNILRLCPLHVGGIKGPVGQQYH